MNITWHGHSCFRLTERGMATVVTDPYNHKKIGYSELNLSADGHDLRTLLRSGATDEELVTAITGIWESRDDRYSEIRSSQTPGLPKVEMSFIGG